MLSAKRNLLIRNTDAFSLKSPPAALILAENDDLLFEIFLHLPIRSLMRFKSVSKHWHSIISDPHFSRMQSSKNNRASALILHRPVSLNPFHSFVPLEDGGSPVNDPSKHLIFAKNLHDGIKIIASCNGLLLCSTGGRVLKRNYYIYNPTTNKRTMLPHPNSPLFRDIHGEESILSIHLAFDPAKSPYYKVVCVHLSDPFGEEIIIEMYSSDTGLWKVSMKGLKLTFNFSRGVFWNGAINWLPGRGDASYFNVDKEKMGELPVPSFPAGVRFNMIRYYGESCGHLHLVVISDPRSLHFDIYEMKENYSGWFVKYHVDLNALVNVFQETMFSEVPGLYGYPFHILSIVRGQNDEESFLVLYISGKVIRYNILKGNFKKLSDLFTASPDLVGPIFQQSDAFQFVESLSSV